jgi:glycerophosphoryl diester phosphodiesterase
LGAFARSPDATRSLFTVSEWASVRGEQYFIAHRGSGDVIPEHTMEAYRAAVAWGAQCLEISVAMTADGVLICMHDLTFDRTTNFAGPIREHSSAVLNMARVIQPQLGEYWVTHAPRVPRFEDVLHELGGQVILAVEAKEDAAFDPMVRMIEEYGLQDSVIIKSFHESSRWVEAQKAGYPVFCYLGTLQLSPDLVRRTASKLNPDNDYLVIPGFADDGSFVHDDLVDVAVASGVPVWVYPLHRRSEASHFFARGLPGAICSSYGYIAGSVSSQSTDKWQSQAITAGEVSRRPTSAAYAPKFTRDGELQLGVQDAQHYMTMGNISPTSIGIEFYTIEVEVGWQVLPSATSENVSVVFGRADDSYYEHRFGKGNGYHAILRASGGMELYRHDDGRRSGRSLAPAVPGSKLKPGQYVPLRVSVASEDITVERLDTGQVLSSNDQSFRGGYVHLGRSSTDGTAIFRHLRVR